MTAKYMAGLLQSGGLKFTKEKLKQVSIHIATRPTNRELKMKAFPNMTNQQGMDLRDYFAGQVIGMFTGSSTWDERAATAYAIADAMMKAREEKRD